MHIFLVSAYNSQDFAQSQENFARSHDGETVTFRNSATAPSPLSYLILANFPSGSPHLSKKKALGMLFYIHREKLLRLFSQHAMHQKVSPCYGSFE